MPTLDEVKPTVKQRVIDLVSAAGIDVSDWGKFAGGEKRAASNPRYCYEWSFLKPGGIVVLNLWYRSLREQNGIVSADLNLRKSVRRYAEGGKGAWRTRAEKLDIAIQDAAKNLLPVRVIINDGKMRAADDLSADASRVERRLLDPVPWAVTSYDWKTGECRLIRGGLPGRFVDQFFLQPEIEAEVELLRAGRSEQIYPDRPGGSASGVQSTVNALATLSPSSDPFNFGEATMPNMR